MKAYSISIIAYIITSIPLLFVTNFITCLITVIFMGFGFGGMLYFVYLIIADVIDEDELKTGVRREGTFFGITNFFMRLSMILSILTVGLVFTGADWSDYTPKPGVNTILGLKMLVFLFPTIALLVTLICLLYYPFSKSKVEEIKTKLLEMHKKKREKVRSV
jgi:GPH family glycoside/pentoside/hexuronide:cation symporter